MREIKNLGIRGTGDIDKRYGTERTATYSLFECPVCLKQYELIRSKGERRNTCHDCKGTQATKHGMAGTKIYAVWNGIHQRCSNPKHTKYAIYGGKGIKVCDAWQTFEGFWEDVKKLYVDGLTIDRPDSSTDYSPTTTRWITKRQNSSETTKRRPVTQYQQIFLPIKGFMPIKEWESAKQAADSLGMVAAHITATCMGNRKTHGGFSWQYSN